MASNGFLNEQGLAIRSARLARSMTQSVLAEGAGVSEKTVRRAEAGERLQAETVLALCSVLGLDPANLRSEAEMDPKAEFERRRERIRVGILTAGMGLALVAASFTGVLIARSGGGYREAMDLTLGSVWLNAYVLGFGALNVIPMMPLFRKRVPGMDRLNRALAPIEPYGLSVTLALVAYAMATMLPFAIADGWTAIRSGGETFMIVRGILGVITTVIAVTGLAMLISGSGTWHKWAEKRMARGAKPA